MQSETETKRERERVMESKNKLNEDKIEKRKKS